MAEGARLESVYTLTRIAGSNPALTATEPKGSFFYCLNSTIYPEMSIREARDEFVFLIDSLTQQKSYTALTFSDVYNEWLNLKKTQVKNWKDISQRL